MDKPKVRVNECGTFVVVRTPEEARRDQELAEQANRKREARAQHTWELRERRERQERRTLRTPWGVRNVPEQPAPPVVDVLAIAREVLRPVIPAKPVFSPEVVAYRTAGMFNRTAAEKAPKTKGEKTNDPSRICPKGRGGTKGGKGATNPKVIARNERRRKRHAR